MPSLLAPWPCPFPQIWASRTGSSTSLTQGLRGALGPLPLCVRSTQPAWSLARGAQWGTSQGLQLALRPGPESSADPDTQPAGLGSAPTRGRAVGRQEGSWEIHSWMHHGSFHGHGVETISYERGNSRCPPQASPFISFQETFQTRFAHAFETNMVWPNPCDHFINQRLPSPWECSWRPRGNGDHPWE